MGKPTDGVTAERLLLDPFKLVHSALEDRDAWPLGSVPFLIPALETTFPRPPFNENCGINLTRVYLLGEALVVSSKRFFNSW